MFVGIGVGIGRQRFGGGIFSAYAARVVADGGVTEAGSCVNAVSTLLQTASLLLVPSGYKSGKVYSQIPTNGNGDLTWTRGSDAVRTNSTGLLESMATGVPRLSYMYGSCPALLLEPQRTNLGLNSEDLTTISWLKGTGVTITANQTTAPDGNTTADLVTGATGTGTWNSANTLGATTILSSSTLYFASIYLRSTTSSSSVVLRFRDQTTGAENNITCNLTSSWQRFDTSRTSGASTTQLAIVLTNATADFYAWGRQIEAGTYPTTYIPTTSATATRVADSFTRNNIYTNNLISASGGTWFVELRNNIPFTRDTFADGVILKDNTGQNGFVFTFGLSSPSAGFCLIRKIVGGVLTSLYTTTTTTVKSAIKWNGTTADIFVNGVKVVTATSFSATQLEILSSTGADTTKFIQQMALYSSPLSDTDCILITTL